MIAFIIQSNNLTGFPAAPGLPEKPISPGKPFILKRESNSGYDLTEMFRIIMFGLYLQEVQGALGFQAAQVDLENPANKIFLITLILTLQPKLEVIF